MKPKHCEDWQEETPLTVGSASGASGDDDDEHPVAVLWLPDPEQRSGWRYKSIWPRQEKKPARRCGFGKDR